MLTVCTQEVELFVIVLLAVHGAFLGGEISGAKDNLAFSTAKMFWMPLEIRRQKIEDRK